MYDPHKSGRRIIKSSDWWIILRTDEGLIEYYKYLIGRKWDVKFEQTIWGSHISVNRGVAPPNKELWGKYKGEKVEFQYTNNIYRANDLFFCIDAYSKRLEEIRVELGLTPQPKYGFHLTIGRINKLYAEERQQDPYGFKKELCL